MIARTHYRPPEIAKQLGVGVETVLGWIRAGQLRAANIGAGSKKPRWLIAVADLQNMLDSRCQTKSKTETPTPRPKQAYVKPVRRIL